MSIAFTGLPDVSFTADELNAKKVLPLAVTKPAVSLMTLRLSEEMVKLMTGPILFVKVPLVRPS